MRTTVGQLLVNRVLPEELRDYERELDKKAISRLLHEVAKKYPERYVEISHKLAQIGHRAAYTTGGNSFGLRHLRKAAAARKIEEEIRRKLATILADDSLSPEERNKKIIAAVGKYSDRMKKAVYEESLKEENPLALQVLSGSRGSPMNLASLRGADLLYVDHRNRVLPIPVLRSYSQGLTPLEYWAGTYGARKGVVDVKMATQRAGFLSKQLAQIAHRAVVTALDADKPSDVPRGLPVETADEDNEGALLAIDTGGYPRNTVLTPKILSDLQRKGIKRILVRSPAVGGAPDGGLYARDVGIREHSRMPEVGESVVGLGASQAISEPLSQSQLSSKHSSGVAGASSNRAVSGFDYINQLVQVPKHFKGGAAHATVDGLVQRVEDAPAGGKYIWIEGQKHYVGQGFKPLVRKGDKVEAGDVISDGIPNPAMVVKYKGIGEGRRYFTEAFRRALVESGIRANRRNVELLARGAVNHIRLTDEIGDFVPDDVVPYSMLEAKWKPRPGHRRVPVRQALGKYLERPYLHYSIGDRIRPSMLRDFEEFGVKEVDVHDEPPPFVPEMVRGMANIQHDPDWMVRMLGSGQQKSVLTAVRRGGTSSEQGTSFVPALAKGVNFNRTPPLISKASPVAKFSQAAQATLARVKEAQGPRQLSMSPEQIASLEQAADFSRMERPLTKQQLELLLKMRAYAEARQLVEDSETRNLMAILGRDLDGNLLPGNEVGRTADTATGLLGLLGGGVGDIADYLVRRKWNTDLKEQLRKRLETSTAQYRPELPKAGELEAYLLPPRSKEFEQYNEALRKGEPVPLDVLDRIWQGLEQRAQESGTPPLTPEALAAVQNGLDRQVFAPVEELRARQQAAQELSDLYRGGAFMATRHLPDWRDRWDAYWSGISGGSLLPGPLTDLQVKVWKAMRDYRDGKIRDLGLLNWKIRQAYRESGLPFDVNQVKVDLDEIRRKTGLELPSNGAAPQQVVQAPPQAGSPAAGTQMAPPAPAPQVAQQPVTPPPQQPPRPLPQSATPSSPPPQLQRPVPVAPAPNLAASNPETFRPRLSSQWGPSSGLAGMATLVGGAIRQSPQVARSLVRATGPLGAGIFGLAVSPKDTMTLLRGAKNPFRPRMPKPTATPGPKVQPVKSKTETPV